jgi:hypothetical protein
MSKITLIIAALTSILFSACQSKSTTKIVENTKSAVAVRKYENKLSDINFTVLKNYYVKNTFTKLDNPKIETAEKFNEVFGMATTMGKNGKPTAIDFSKQYIIAIIIPATEFSTSIDTISLQINNQNQINLNYKVTIGQKQSFSIRPFLAIAVDKQESGIITVEEIK